MNYFNVFLFLLLAATTTIHAQITEMVIDLAEGPDDGISSEALILGAAGNSFALLNNDEIILSDGSEEGTKVIGDIGTNGYALHTTRTVFNGKIYVVINNDEADYSLLEIDPDAETVTSVLSGYDYIADLLVYNDKLYCQLGTSTFVREYASVDVNTGTTEQIFPVDDFGGVRASVVHQGLIYLIYWRVGLGASYLGYTDGTPGNITPVKQLHSGSEFSQTESILMTSAGDLVYFFYYASGSNYALQASDGTQEGTTVVQSGFERIPFFDYEHNRMVGAVGNSLLFRAKLDGEFDEHLWLTDGTADGTCILKFAGEDEDMEPQFFTPFNDKMYIYAKSGPGAWSAVRSMVISDGTKEGTLAPYNDLDHEDNIYSEGWQMNALGDKIYFMGESDDYGPELYSYAGTFESITRLSEIAPGDAYSSFRKLTPAGEHLFFIGDNEEFGNEIWVHKPNEISSTSDLELARVDVMPNPTSTHIMIPEFESTLSSIIISNQAGRQVMKIEEDLVRNLRVDHLIAGHYTISFITETGQYYSRFCKI